MPSGIERISVAKTGDPFGAQATYLNFPPLLSEEADKKNRLFTIVVELSNRPILARFFFCRLAGGSDDTDHDRSQERKGCEKGNHVQVPYNGHMSAPDYLCLTGGYYDSKPGMRSEKDAATQR